MRWKKIDFIEILPWRRTQRRRYLTSHFERIIGIAMRQPPKWSFHSTISGSPVSAGATRRVRRTPRRDTRYARHMRIALALDAAVPPRVG
jgi:hypothetical protein